MRIGVLAGSVASAILGLVLIRLARRGGDDPSLAAQEQLAEGKGLLGR